MNNRYALEKRENKRKGISLLEITLIIISLFAFAYAIGQSIPSVSANEGACYSFNGQEYKLSGNKLVCKGATDSCDGQLTSSEVCKNPGGAWASCTGNNLDPSKLPNCQGLAQTPEPTSTGGDFVYNFPSVLSTAILPTGVGRNILPTSGAGAPTPTELPGVTPPITPPTGPVNPIFDVSVKKALGHIFQTAAIAAAIYFGSKWILNKIPGISPAFAEAGAAGLTAGYVFHEIGIPVLQRLFGPSVLSGPAGWIVSGIVALVVFAFTYKEVKFAQVTFTCNPWVAPFGGDECGKCNSQDFPCTEYQCKSLGQGCELINPGTQDSLCVWINEGDTKPPVISPWEEVLTVGYKYSPDTASSPPDRGVRVVNENSADGCVEPWTRLTLGISLDEAATCKMSELNANSYDNMENNYWSGGIAKINHSFTFSLPSPQFLEANNITLKNNGEFSLYTRCIDTNGRANTGNFVFRYCVGDADLTEPQIYATSLFNNSPIGFGQTSVDLKAYVNEPVDCRWSRISQDYDTMENTFSCSQNAVQFNGQIVYPCSTTLNGLNDYPAENDYFFRCRDQPELEGTADEADRRTNGESYLFRLLGSRELAITKVEPNGTISDSTEPIKVTLKAETFAGSNEGEALCYFSTNSETGFGQFFNTGGFKHSQELYLGEGDYTYYVKCIDAGGNVDQRATSFTVEADTESPVVVRAYHEGTNLNIITNEEASCVYSNVVADTCTYLIEDGQQMTSLENNKHQTAWNPSKTYYIKCMDEFGNPPPSNECSIIIRPFDIN